MAKQPRAEPQTTRYEQLRDGWKLLGLYQRFESIVALILTVVIGLIIVVALVRLGATVVTGLLLGVLDPLEPAIFQSVFGEVLTVLIALEFNHTLQFVVARHQSIIQTKVVLLIALLAIARKFIVLDIDKTPPAELLGLAAITLSLGIVYWLMRERDDRTNSLKLPPD
jgi:uncharacterized membrane protein (DUF373 family)